MLTVVTSRAIAAVSQGIVANLQWFANASRDFGGLPVALVDDGELAQARPTGLSVFLRG